MTALRGGIEAALLAVAAFFLALGLQHKVM
jgi:hypothetical protein